MKPSTEHYTRDYLWMYGYDADNFGQWYAVPTVASAFPETLSREIRYFDTRREMRDFLKTASRASGFAVLWAN